MDKPSYQCPQCGFGLESKSGLCNFCGAMYSIEDSKITITGQTCFNCGHQAEIKLNNCPKCGTEYLVECPKCAHLYKPGPATCPECGYDNSTQIHTARKDRVEKIRSVVIPDHPIRIFIRIAIIFAIMLGMFSIFDRIDWHGPQGFGGLLLLLGILSVVVMFVFFSPLFGKTTRVKPKRPNPKDDFALVYRTLDLAMAEQLKSLLESEGIPTFIYNRDATTLVPFDIFSGIRVMVPQTMLAQVYDIMDAFGFDTDEVPLDKKH